MHFILVEHALLMTDVHSMQVTAEVLNRALLFAARSVHPSGHSLQSRGYRVSPAAASLGFHGQSASTGNLPPHAWQACQLDTSRHVTMLRSYMTQAEEKLHCVVIKSHSCYEQSAEG